MSPSEYLDSVKERLLTDPNVTEFHVRRERSTLTDGHLRVRVSISDGSLLEFSEYIERTQEARIEGTVYSYHWENEEGQLIYRWDNTPHFPGWYWIISGRWLPRNDESEAITRITATASDRRQP